MVLDLTSEQRSLLLQLVDAELRELGTEIRHTDGAKGDLKDRRRALQALHDLLTSPPVGVGPPERPPGVWASSP